MRTIDHVLIAIDRTGVTVPAVAAHTGGIAVEVGADVTLFRAYAESACNDFLEETGFDTAPLREMA